MVTFAISAVTPVQAEGDIGDVTLFEFVITRGGTFDPTFSYQVSVDLDRLQLDLFDVAFLENGNSADVVFSGAETQKSVFVRVRGDTVKENDELFRLTISESNVQGRVGPVGAFTPIPAEISGSGSALSLVLNDDEAGDIVPDALLIQIAGGTLGLTGEDVPGFARPNPEAPTDATLQADQQNDVGALISAVLEDCILTDEEIELLENAIDDPFIRADLNSKLGEALERCEEEHAKADGVKVGFHYIPYETGTVATRSGDAGLDLAYMTVDSPHLSDVMLGSEGDILTLINNETLVLFDIERLSFSDQTLALDIDGTAATAYRLYQAAFDRVPDLGGLGYWIREFDAGRGDLLSVSASFIASDEFQTTYGSTSNAEFLTLLYDNVLDRAPDAAGLNYWNGQLSNGFSRAGVLASFSESAENRANVAAAIEDGIWYV